jgi:photosystem II stability/assembly factor-like uncharacterized protein
MKILLHTSSVWIALLLIANLAAAQEGWFPITLPTTADLTSVSFANEDSGVVVGAARTILRTTDRGATWLPINLGEGSQLNAVSFANDSVGVAGGFDGQILSTHTGGASWEVIQEGYMVSYRAAHMVTGSFGVVMGMNTIMQPFGTKTANRWQNYSNFNFYVQHENVGYEGAVYGVHFFNSNVGCAVVDIWDGHGAVVKTTDGGQTWITKYWGVSSLYAIEFPSPEVGYVCGASGFVAKSTDSGETWRFINTQMVETFWGLACWNIDTAWVVGDDGVIVRTMDGGNSARLQPSGVTTTLRSIHFVNDTVGFVAGDGGTLLQTNSGGVAPNLPPGAFTRMTPLDGHSQPYYRFGTLPIRFSWTAAVDPNEDPVQYVIRISSEFGAISAVTYDTTYADSLNDLIEFEPPPTIIPIHWTVIATDGWDSTEVSNGPGVFDLDFIGAAGDRPTLATTYSLSAYPNPFNPTTTLAFSLVHAGDATLDVYDLQGRRVWQKFLKGLAAGSHQVAFDGSQLPSGVYISRLNAGQIQKSAKLLLVK